MTAVAKNAVADIMTIAMAHNVGGRRCNKVSLVTRVKTGADKDLGIAGTTTETVTELCPEPFIGAVSGKDVQKSGGSFWWSDLKLGASRDSLTEAEAMSQLSEFEINGERYAILATLPGPTEWEFVVRRKTSSPVTP